MQENNEDTAWQRLGNSVILGDSRAEGFSYYEVLPQERVLAKSGNVITNVKGYLDKVKALAPDEIYLCFGLNDILSGLWPEPSDYVLTCEKYIELLKEEFPNSTIYLNSILPVVGKGLEANPDSARIEEYNEALKGMAEEKGYLYVDNTEMAAEHEDLYQEDGVHVQKEFYKCWAINMLTEVER